MVFLDSKKKKKDSENSFYISYLSRMSPTPSGLRQGQIAHLQLEMLKSTEPDPHF